MLNNNAIKEEVERESIYVDNSDENIGDNFIVLTLGDTLKIYDTPFLDVTKSSPTKEIHIKEEGITLKPGELYIGRTLQFTKTYGFVPMLGTFDEIAVLGMEIHVTAGFGDNGFNGTWTLEIVCANPTKVYPNMPIGLLYYHPIVGNCDILYNGKYFKQVEPTASKLSEEYCKRKVKTKNVNE